ncbi:hypothetical protein DFH06DRAFT_1343604 [Mycena polygramma]|nr:hypothetical protein DFH06DRAFT_1343604 [Mycena polygramma]
MPLFRIFRSPASEWLSTSVDIARGLVSVSNCVPFPYVNTALSAGLMLLELIQTVGQSDEDLKYLSESVVAIMKLLREEVESHPTENTLFRNVCEEFTSSGSVQVRDRFRTEHRQHYHFTRRVNDLRANATLVAATGTRMDLAGVESRISGLIVSQHSPKIDSEDDLTQSELARLENDFHALKLGDIYLDFRSARTNSFAIYANGSEESPEEKEMGWTDYRATVNGSLRTVRVYQGSSPTESWKDFLFFLAGNLPSAHLPQLFGFCSSPRLRCLVFHGEYQTLDEYGATLFSAQAIVDWELDLLSDLAALHYDQISIVVDHWQTRHSAMVDARDGKLVLSHIQRPGELYWRQREWDQPFIEWFAQGLWLSTDLRQRHQLSSQWDMATMLRTVAPDDTWAVVRLALLGSAQLLAYQGTPPRDCYPTADKELKNGFTHFIVPLKGNDQPWSSNRDHKVHCGYFLAADLQFGNWASDVSYAWLAQASSIIQIPSEQRQRMLSNCYIPTSTSLSLIWEMVLAAENTAPESIALLDDLPERIHVFVELLKIKEGHIEEPEIYWSTDPNEVETRSVPCSALKIWMSWRTRFQTVHWEDHPYEVAEAKQKRLGFDPTTNAAAKSLDLPLLGVSNVEASEQHDPGMFCSVPESVFIVPRQSLIGDAARWIPTPCKL